MSNERKLYTAVLEGREADAVAAAKAALEAGVDPQAIISTEMVPAMDEVGRLFECNEYYVVELLMSAKAMKGALQLLTPLLAAGGREPAGRVAIGTVKGDLHDIGKNIVAALLEGGGFKIIDLGIDAGPEKFVEAVRSGQANIVAMSALLTTTMTAMKSTIDELAKSGVRDRVKVMVGGAPLTQRYADEIGADGYASNAAAAVPLAKRLIGAA